MDERFIFHDGKQFVLVDGCYEFQIKTMLCINEKCEEFKKPFKTWNAKCPWCGKTLIDEGENNDAT